MLTCYTTCCCVNSTNSESKDRTKQLSVLYKTNAASSGSDRIDSHSTENGTGSAGFTNIIFADSSETRNDKTSSGKDETRTAGLAKDMKIVITSTADGDVEELENSPIRRSAGAYYEIDLRGSSMQNERLEDENMSVEKKRKASSKKKSKSKKK